MSNNSKYTLADIENLKNTMGTIGEPVFSGDRLPATLINVFSEDSKLHSFMDKVAVPEDDKELLNRFLVALQSAIKLGGNLPNECEGAKLVSSSINGVNDFGEEHLEALNSMVSEKFEMGKIKNIDSQSTIYEFSEGGLRMYDRVKKVPIENVSVGLNEGYLSIISHTDEPNETGKIQTNWWVFELEEGEKYAVPVSIVGVGEVEVSECYLTLLEEASEILSQNNDRLLKSKVDQYKKWQEKVSGENEVYAIVGGSQIGDIENMTEFFEKLELIE
jgi:hypothetical protein